MTTSPSAAPEANRRALIAVIAVAAVAVVAVIAVLLASRGSGATDLTDRQWQLTSVTQQQPAFQGVVPAAEQLRYTITFNTDATYNANADCNQVAGTYEASGSNLTIKRARPR